MGVTPSSSPPRLRMESSQVKTGNPQKEDLYILSNASRQNASGELFYKGPVRLRRFNLDPQAPLRLLPRKRPSHTPRPSPKADIYRSTHKASRLIQTDSSMEHHVHHADAYGFPVQAIASDSSSSSGGFKPSVKLVRLIQILDVDFNQSSIVEPQDREAFALED